MAQNIIQIGGWNVTGIESMKEIEKAIYEAVELDICGLCNTNSVRIAIGEKWRNNKIDEERVADSLVWVRMRVGNATWCIVCALVNNKKRMQRLQELLTSLRNDYSGDKLVLVGDFKKTQVGNDVIETESGIKIVHAYGVADQTENGKKLVEICIRHKLQITNTLFKGEQYTRRLKARNYTVQDYICTDWDLRDDLVDFKIIKDIRGNYFIVKAEIRKTEAEKGPFSRPG